MISNETKFRPVVGLEEDILAAPHVEGYVYYAYDTGKHYLYAFNNLIPIGGSGVALFYAEQSEVTQDGNDNYIIKRESITEEGVALKINDLIINSNGSFYKVIDFDSNEDYLCAQIAVSGTGGGGGGGGSTTVADTRLIYDNRQFARAMTFIYNQDNYIDFTCESDVDYELDLAFTITQNNKLIESFVEYVDNGDTYHFNTKRLPKGENITIAVNLSSQSSTMSDGVNVTKQSIKTVELSIAKDSNFNAATIQNGECGIGFIPYNNGLTQTLHVLIDGTELDLSSIAQNKTFLSFKPNGDIYTVRIPQQGHGTHIITMYMSTTISNVEMNSDSISYEVAWMDSSDTTPVIWVGNYDSLVIQYNETIIPFMVYNPQTEKYSQKTKVYLVCNGVEIPTSPMEVSYDGNEWIRWDVTNLLESAPDAGKVNTFTITCGSTTKRITITCTSEGSRDLDLVNKNQIILNLVSTGRSNSETSQSRETWSYGNFTTEFTDFNWYNNGWLNDNDGNGSYLSIANGAKTKINLRTLALNSTTDYSFEIRFRVRNIQEYSTLIRTIPYYFINEDNKSHTVEDIKKNGYTYKRDDDGNTMMDEAGSVKKISDTAGVVFSYLNSDKEGFCIGTQEAYFKTPASIANVRYKEDEIISIGFVISKTNNLLSIYLNGILSGALDLSSTKAFSMDNDCFEINSNYCDIDIYKIRIYEAELTMPNIIHNYISDIHDVDLYDQNQLTNKNDGTILEYCKLVEFNDNIATYNNGKTLSNQKEYSMPYAVWEIIDNGTGINDPNKGTHSSDDDKLPYFKGNNRYCKITFVNPALDAALDAGTITEDFYYTHSPSYVCIGADINVQGTSSQAYPRRNMKTKMSSAVKKTDADGIVHEDWGWYYTKGSKAGETFKKWNMDNANCSTAKFTWKIDYMESSGTYNTGFANLVGNGMYDYHPLSTVPELNNPGTGYRTSVYGFPVLVFHKHSTTTDRNLDEENEYQAYEFVGRYNLNLDKSSNEFYGFEEAGTHPYVSTENYFSNSLPDVAECWELRDNQGTWTSWKYPDAITRADGFGSQTSSGTLEVIKHFEYRYNSEGDAIETASKDTVDSSLTAVKGSGRTVDLSTQANKNAFLREKYQHLESLFNWLDSTDTNVVPTTDTGTPLSEPVTYNTTVYYMVQTFTENSEDIAYYVNANGEKLVRVSAVSEVDDKHYYVYTVEGENIMTQAIAADDYTGTKRSKDDILITYNTDCADYRLKKFVAEFNKHLDLEYCLVYFILSELLLCYDSRGKNMMIASWGPQEANGDYIWFPIWYDIDTQLGLNNIGAVLWDYDTDATAEGTFSTANSVLWQNFFAGFRTAIEEKYRTLRKGSRLTEKTIEGAYLCDPDVFATSYAMRGVRPVIALGLDEWTKYIACGVNKSSTWYTGRDRRYGFYVRSYDNGNSKTTDASYVYTCQGDRKLSRELFIRNRLNYLDSWWLAGAYDSTASAYKNEIMIRANANDTATSDKYLDQSKISSDVSGYTRAAYPVKFYDAVPQFEITPFLSQYVTIFYDEDPLTPTIKYDGLNAVTTHTTPSVENGYRAIYPYNEQLTYIPGGDFLSDLGDLSLKYPSHFKLQTGKRLIELNIGSDAPKYENGIIGKEAGTFDLNDSASGTNKKGLLQKINLTGLTALSQAQDISGSEKLREFRALRTQIPYPVFAQGAPLDTVHLPISTTTIELVYALNLKKMLRSTPVTMIEDEIEGYVQNNHDAYEGLYVEGLTDWTKPESFEGTISNVNTINLSNVALGYNSFILLDNAIDIRERFRTSGYLALNLEKVEWSPYKAVESDKDYSDDETFYRLTDHGNFAVYQHNSATEWERLKTNQKIFQFDSTEPKELITSLADLDIIINDYERATSVASNHYRNIKVSETKTLPNITGTLYVDNSDESAEAISEIELQDTYKQYFPDLKIYAAKITESYIAKFVQDLGNGREDELDLIRYDKVAGAHCTMTDVVPIKTNYDFQGWTLDSQYASVDKDQVDTLKNEGKILGKTEIEALEFSASKTDYVFYAVFSITSYTISFKDPITENTYTSYKADYGTYLYDPDYLATTDESNLTETQRYKFLGWVSDKTNSFPKTAGAAKLVKLTDIMSQNNDRTFYGCFIAESATDNATDLSYFQFTSTMFYHENGGVYNIEQGVYVSAAAGKSLSGKITIPTEYNGLPVIGISNSGFSANATQDGPGVGITHIYWLGDTSNVRLIDSNAFWYCRNLKYFQMPKNLRVINSQAFLGCSSLALPDFYNTKLITIGSDAFSQAIYNAGRESLLQLPGCILTIGEYAFQYYKFENGLETLQFGGPGDPCQLTSVGQNAFWQNQESTIGNIIFYIGDGSDQSVLENVVNTARYSGTVSYLDA